LDIRHVHIYGNDSIPNLNVKFLTSEISRMFTSCKVDYRKPLQVYWSVENFQRSCELARISEPKQPFEKQPKRHNGIPLYDGFVLQEFFRAAISDNELDMTHAHVVLTDMLTCTFDEDDWRYHARPVICGSPSIVSSSGIVEGPAKPKQYYFLARPGSDPSLLQKQFAGRFLTNDDERLNSAILGYSVQAIFFFITNGEPFCADRKCRLHNAHWQEDLILQVEKPVLCEQHAATLKKFNAHVKPL
jgi:hypothetical protein